MDRPRYAVKTRPASVEKASRRVSWDPAAYAANSASQQSWARELIAGLHLRGHEHIVDVGCGDGKVTAELARAVPRGAVLGVDASPEMIGFARAAFPPSNHANLRFEIMDARALRLEAAFDLVFSNAALHWVDDHPAFLRGAAAGLRPGGRLVVSCGGKGNAQDVFVTLRAEIRLKRWKPFFRKIEKPYFFHQPEDYREWLPRAGFAAARVRLVEKEMLFPGPDGFAGWFRTTWLPYTQRVPEDRRPDFTAAVTGRYLARHPPDAAGRVRVRMVRLELEATRAAPCRVARPPTP
jgi:trans-aconitate 2-methyltransferase